MNKPAIDPQASDDALIRAASRGDRGAFRLLVDRYRNQVLALATRLLGDADDARDVAQEVFIRVYRYLDTYNHRTKFFTWLYRIAVNASYDWLRRRRRYREVALEQQPGASFVAAARPERQELLEKVAELLDQLSTAQKTTFVLRDVEGFSVKETAAIMELPTGTVKSNLHHARQNLQRLVRVHYPELLEGHYDDLLESTS